MEKFTAVFEQEGDWWMAYAEELPGANTQGKTLEEARTNLREAIQLIVEANRELARRALKARLSREELLWLSDYEAPDADQTLKKARVRVVSRRREAFGLLESR